MVAILAGVGGWFFLLAPKEEESDIATAMQPDNTMASAPTQEAELSDDKGYREIQYLNDFSGEKWDEGTVMYDGKLYKYNENLQNYLFMGIDNDDIVKPAPDGISGGQSDAMFLLVLDEDKRDAKVVAINRNTMVPVDVYNENGDFLLQMELQICLQHGYGDGMKLSCIRATEAVDRLFRGVPITGYMSLNVGGIPAVNDAVGGVEITPIETVKRGDVIVKKGEPVTLSGEQAYAYLRTRDTDKFGSADDRLERQKQYIPAFINKLLAEPSLANKVYEAGKDYIVASIDLPKLIKSSQDMTFTDDQIYTIEGNTEEKDNFEQYHIDEDAMIRLILDVFYDEVQ